MALLLNGRVRGKSALLNSGGECGAVLFNDVTDFKKNYIYIYIFG
jgi:hypothetical protein